MSNDFWRWAGKTLGKTQQTFDEARKEAERMAREAGSIAQEMAGEAGRGMSVAAEQLQQLINGVEADDLVQIAALPEHLRVAFAGSLYALAVADGALDKEELHLIVDLVDLSGLSPAGRELAQSYVLTPPKLADTLAPFGTAPETVRYALMLNLLEIAWANDLLTPAQDSLLTTAQAALAINEEQYRALWRFVRELRAIRLRGQNDSVAAQATKTAAAGLAAVGVPLAAVYVSGSVIGLSAAGITSGLAALGLGLGMVPGIGVAVLLGTAVFFGVRSLMEAGQQPEREQFQRQLRSRGQERINDMEAMISLLDQAINDIGSEDTLAAGLRLSVLYERRRALQQILARRRALLATLPNL